MKKLLAMFNLWAEYNDDYIYMHQHHLVNDRTRATKGYKFMRNGWRIVGIIVFIIYLIGAMGK